MTKLWNLMLVLMLTSCASIQNANSPDFEKSEMQQGVFISCNGYKTWKNCHQTAEKTCPLGYEVMSLDENHLNQMRTLRVSCKQ